MERAALLRGMHMHQPTLNIPAGRETGPKDRVDPGLSIRMSALSSGMHVGEKVKDSLRSWGLGLIA